MISLKIKLNRRQNSRHCLVYFDYIDVETLRQNGCHLYGCILESRLSDSSHSQINNSSTWSFSQLRSRQDGHHSPDSNLQFNFSCMNTTILWFINSHWGRDKMVVISQIRFPNWFLLCENFNILIINSHWGWSKINQVCILKKKMLHQWAIYRHNGLSVGISLTQCDSVTRHTTTWIWVIISSGSCFLSNGTASLLIT